MTEAVQAPAAPAQPPPPSSAPPKPPATGPSGRRRPRKPPAPPPPPISRRALISLEIVDEICRWIEGGNAEYVAAGALGVSDRTFRLWLQRGKAAKDAEEDGTELPEREVLYAELYHRISIARRRAIARNVQIVQEAAAADPRHAEWWLRNSRTAHRFYGELQKIEHSGPDGAPIETKETGPRRLEIILTDERADGPNDPGAAPDAPDASAEPRADATRPA